MISFFLIAGLQKTLLNYDYQVSNSQTLASDFICVVLLFEWDTVNLTLPLRSKNISSLFLDKQSSPHLINYQNSSTSKNKSSLSSLVLNCHTIQVNNIVTFVHLKTPH